MTAVEFLVENLDIITRDTNKYDDFKWIFEHEIAKAKEMEKQQIIDAYIFGLSDEYVIGSDKYYTSIYGSKGSDATSSQTEISDESWEGCDGCTEQDEVMYKNGYVKGYNSAISELPKEISDEEIEKSADYYGDRWIDAREAFYGFLEGAKWYREQLKTK